MVIKKRFQGPVRPTTDEERFRETGESIPQFQGPVRPTTDEERFRETGRSIQRGSSRKRIPTSKNIEQERQAELQRQAELRRVERQRLEQERLQKQRNALNRQLQNQRISSVRRQKLEQRREMIEGQIKPIEQPRAHSLKDFGPTVYGPVRPAPKVSDSLEKESFDPRLGLVGRPSEPSGQGTKVYRYPSLAESTAISSAETRGSLQNVQLKADKYFFNAFYPTGHSSTRDRGAERKQIRKDNPLLLGFDYAAGGIVTAAEKTTGQKISPGLREQTVEGVSDVLTLSAFSPLISTGAAAKGQKAKAKQVQKPKKKEKPKITREDIKDFLVSPTRSGKTVNVIGKGNSNFQTKRERSLLLLRSAKGQKGRQEALKLIQESYGKNFLKDLASQEGIGLVQQKATQSAKIIIETPPLKTLPVAKFTSGIPIVSQSKYAGLGLYEKTDMSIPRLNTKQDNSLKLDTKTLTETKPDIKIKVLTVPKVSSGRAITTAVTPITNQLQTPKTKQTLRVAQKQNTKQVQRLRTPNTFGGFIPRYPRQKPTKNFPKPRLDLYKPKYKSKTPFGTAVVEVRRYGSFKPVATTKNLNKAINIGSNIVRSSLAASFRVRGTGRLKTPSGFTRKGNVFTERRGLRLGSLTERMDIQKARKKKRRSLF